MCMSPGSHVARNMGVLSSIKRQTNFLTGCISEVRSVSVAVKSTCSSGPELVQISLVCMVLCFCFGWGSEIESGKTIEIPLCSFLGLNVCRQGHKNVGIRRVSLNILSSTGYRGSRRG
jgi:hypothetical protein